MPSNVETIRHSASHVLAEAVLKIYPGTKLGIGPAIDDGFYYDFQFPSPIQVEDLPAIEKEMRRIIASGAEFVRKEVSKEEARKLFAGQSFKLDFPEDTKVRAPPQRVSPPRCQLAPSPTLARWRAERRDIR